MLVLSIVFILVYGASMAAMLLFLRPRDVSSQAAVLQSKLDALAESLSSQKGELDALRSEGSEIAKSLARKEEEARNLLLERERLNSDLSKSRDELDSVKSRFQDSLGQCSSLAESLKLTKVALEESRTEIAKLKERASEDSEALLASSAEASRLKAEFDAAEKRLLSQETEMKRLQEESLTKFESLASRLLEEKGEKFTKLHAEKLSEILTPLRENIGDFKKRVEDVYERESKDRVALQEQIKNISEMNMRVGEDAKRLTEALKGDSKVMGDWGEMLLDSILEGSGLQKDQEYFKQESVRDDEGRLLRPDVIIKLPQGKTVIVDSKVSITAYVECCNAIDDVQKADALQRHLRSVKAHVDELAAKDYQAHVDGTLDFVVMFVPNEPAYNLAMRHDSSLWQYAYSRKIVLASPTNLFAILKIASELWRKEKEAKNYLEIAERGAAIYDKLAAFIDFMDDVGKNLENARRAYDKAVNNLKDGRGNLVGQVEKMRSLGLKTKRQIAEEWRDAGDELASEAPKAAAKILVEPAQDELPLS